MVFLHVINWGPNIIGFEQKAHLYENRLISQKVAAEHLFSLMETKPTHTILDVGCGTGYLTELMASKTKNVPGIDIAPKMIEQA
jgi:malonyl-CoA O-methyltransferase